MKDTMKAAFGLLCIALACLAIGSCARWHWNECRKVGHGIAYCIYDLGRN